MLKVLNVKLITIIITATAVGAIAISVPVFNNVSTSVKETQNSNNKENYTNSDLNSLSDTDSSDKKVTDSSIEKKGNKVTSKNTSSNTQIKDTNKEYNASENEQTESSSQINDTNSITNEENIVDVNDTLEVNLPTIQYDRTTSIYADDKITLIRIEYYINNKITYFSDIEQFDATTKSYIEKIYKCNHETDIDPLIRTDVYVNGQLTESY